MTEQEYWFFDSDSSSNQSVQSRRCVWILLVMLASASSLHIQLLSSDSSVYFKSYIPTHHQDLHIHNQRAKQKQTTWNTTHPRWLQETKPTSKPHEILRKTQIGACSTEGKNNLEVACWDRPNLIPHVVPLFISILQRFASTHLAVSSVRGRRHGRQPFNNGIQQEEQIQKVISDTFNFRRYSRARYSKLLNSTYVRGRHNGISVITSVQKFNALNTLIRVNATHLFFYKVRNFKEIELLQDELSALPRRSKLQDSKDALFKMYEIATAEPHSFLYINLLEKDINKMFMIKFNKYMRFDDW